MLNKSGSGPRRLPSAVRRFVRGHDLQHTSISISASTCPPPRGTGRQDSIASSGLQSAIPISPRIMNPVVAEWQMPRPSLNTRQAAFGPSTSGSGGTAWPAPSLWWGVGEWHVENSRFEMRTAHDPRPPASFLYALSQQQLQTTAILHRSSTRHSSDSSPPQSRLEPFLVSWSTSTVLCRTLGRTCWRRMTA